VRSRLWLTAAPNSCIRHVQQDAHKLGAAAQTEGHAKAWRAPPEVQLFVRKFNGACCYWERELELGCTRLEKY